MERDYQNQMEEQKSENTEPIGVSEEKPELCSEGAEPPVDSMPEKGGKSEENQKEEESQKPKVHKMEEVIDSSKGDETGIVDQEEGAQELEQAPDVSIEGPQAPETPTPSPLRTYSSSCSTVIIEEPMMKEFAQPKSKTEAIPKIPRYLLPTESQKAKIRCVDQKSKAPSNGNDFSLATVIRKQGNVVPGRFQIKPSPQISAATKPLSSPHAPVLSARGRKRPSVEEDLPQFKALPLDKDIFKPNSCRGVPKISPRPTTISKAPKLSDTRCSKPQPDQNEGPKRPSSSVDKDKDTQPNDKRLRSTKPTTVPVSPKLQTKARLSRLVVQPPKKA